MRKLIVLCALFAMGSCTCNYSDGVRVGVPYKLSRKGFFINTNEGEMTLGGIREKVDSESGRTSLVPNVFAFTVRQGDYDTSEVIQKAIENGSTIRITYHQVRGITCSTDSGYFVEKVEVLR